VVVDPVRLSLCIPTHDGRRRHLGYLLDSILADLSPDLAPRVEVCVTDNASADGTEAMVAAYQERHPGLFRYARHAIDRGAMRNIFASIELARGDYCWMIGSDDAVAPGGIAAVLGILDAHPRLTGLTVSWATYDADMRAEIYRYPREIMPDACERPARYSSWEEMLRNCGVIHGYLSIQIVRRDDWLAVLRDRPELAEASLYFAYTMAMALMARRRPDWLWHPTLAIRNRAANASWRWVQARRVHRYHVAVTADIGRVWAALLGGRGSLYWTLMTKWYHLCATPRDLINYKIQPGVGWRDDLQMLVGFTRFLYGVGPFWRQAVPVLLTPAAVLRRRARLRQATSGGSA